MQDKLCFKGELPEFESKLNSLDYEIKSKREIPHGFQLEMTNGTKINWFPYNGTIAPTGKHELQEQFRTKWAEGSVSDDGVLVTNAKKKVFVVHGHDENAREQLELILRKLGLNPFVLQSTGGGGNTIIEALESAINSGTTQSDYGIVLLTPDDVGHSAAQEEATALPRARQNVELELGMLLSALGRNRVSILKKGTLEVPSDIQGLLWIQFENHVRETVPKLSQNLQSAGIQLDGKDIADASS